MKTLATCLLLSALALPAYAGQGSIVETDEAFIVEYSGDPSDKPAERVAERPAERPAAAPTAASSAGAPRATPPATPPAAKREVERPQRPPRETGRRDRSTRQPRTSISGDANGAGDASPEE